MEKKYKICFLGYRDLSEAARPVLESLNYEDTEVKLAECNVETLPTVVDAAVSEGYEVFIARSANAAEFRRYSSARLVEIQLSTVDFLIAIRKALTVGQRPAIAVYRFGRSVNLPLLEELSGAKLDLIQYEDSAQLRDAILRMEGDVVIGASHAVELADELGRRSILLHPSEESIRGAVQRARRLCLDMDQEIQRTKTARAILQYAPFGLIVNDMNGRISIFNRAAREFSEIRQERVQGKLLSEILPPLSPEAFLDTGQSQEDRRRLINGVMIRCVQTLIGTTEDRIGVLTTLYPDNARRKKEDEDASQFTARARWKDVVSRSRPIQELLRQAKPCAESDYPLVIQGEAGTGKSFYAQCLHNGSTRAREPYVPVNVSAIPDQDAARVLFGYEDAQGIRPGFLELAGKGTVVLQNLADASRTVQECLLQAVSRQKFCRLGGTTPIPFQARLITLLTGTEGKTGCETILTGLWERLSVLRLTVPPLRERREDVPLLFQFLAVQEAGVSQRRALNAPTEILQAYSWPGNLAELSAVCKRYAFALSQGASPSPAARRVLLTQAIGEENLFAEILREYPALSNPAKGPAEEVLAGIERMKSLLKYNNDKIAEKLSLSRTTLWRMRKSAAEKEKSDDESSKAKETDS